VLVFSLSFREIWRPTSAVPPSFAAIPKVKGSLSKQREDSAGERSVLQLPRLVAPSIPTSGQDWLQNITGASRHFQLYRQYASADGCFTPRW
jgi:hypothetical protein